MSTLSVFRDPSISGALPPEEKGLSLREAFLAPVFICLAFGPSALLSGHIAIGVFLTVLALAANVALWFSVVRQDRVRDATVENAESRIAVETSRVNDSRRAYLSDRGVDMSSSDIAEFFPETKPAEDGLVAMSPGVVDGKATMLALYQRDGELILTGTDGQELRPLVTA